MKLIVHFIFIGSLLMGSSIPGIPVVSEFAAGNYHFPNSESDNNDRNYHGANSLTTFAEVDAAADYYASTKRLYNFKESNDLLGKLHLQLKNNTDNIALNWALMRFYASAPNFVGGNSAIALQYAGYIYSLNEYLGCLAFEYVYTKRKNFDDAEHWYRQSLSVALPKDMYWEEIVYNKTPHLGIKITGNFNNWTTQNMYSGYGGIYKRKVMVSKCETCIYKVIVDYNVKNPSKEVIATNSYW
ncbi:MAG: hypothetical protein KGL19_03690 [Bacteroidota bacterium]|nr:hypothetical protein [Bacteroidota bacterium]